MEDEENDIIRVSDLSEVPDDATGYVLNVNDHGNATLYEIGPQDEHSLSAFASDNLKEIWAIV